MSDIYGMANALKAYLSHLDECSRGTGRTTKMLEMVKDGDLIVCHSAQEAARVKRRCQRQGKEVRTVFGGRGKVFDRVSMFGVEGVHFDHEWVRQNLLDGLYEAEGFIKNMELLCSQREEGHVVTV